MVRGSLMKRKYLAIAACVGTAALSCVSVALADAGSGASPAGAFPLSVNLGSVTGAGQVTIAVDEPSDYNAQGVPQVITEVPVATVPVSAGGAQTLDVPVSSTLTANASNGIANVQLTAVYGNDVSVASAPIPVDAASSSPAATAARAVTGRAIHFMRFRRMPRLAARMAHRSIPSCVWSAYGNGGENEVRIGELHVANIAGSNADWDYHQNADSTIGVTFSASPGGGFSASGTATITNSIGAGGGFDGGQGFLQYVQGDFYWQEYVSSTYFGIPVCSSTYKARYTTSAGDASPGPNQPPANPWGGCNQDPNGHAIVPVNGYYEEDHSTAASYSVGTTLFGVGVSTQTGFTSTIYEHYNNNGSVNREVCGSAQMPNVPIIYES